jgi:ATP-dependent helicase/nuclease subunit B
MGRFIKSVLVSLKQQHYDLDTICFVLPSKRAGVFLKRELTEIIDKPIFAPQSLSIQEFVEDLSGLKQPSNLELLFSFYSTYKNLSGTSEPEPFESFSKWAQLLLQDFNEIDRYLIPQDRVFDYLKTIKELNHWSLEGNQTDLIKSHLKFWNNLKTYYAEFSANLIASKKGYQGLIYREACDNLESYIENHKDRIHVFLGFNALNQSESRIIQELLQNDMALIYWDIDETFIDDTIHDAGLFMRTYRNDWSYFKKHPFNWVSSHYKEHKDIQVFGVPKHVGQAKLIGELLDGISHDNPNFNNVAVVLSEESLLVPVLNSLPQSVKSLNVTMGLPLKFVPLASLFESLFSIHKNNSSRFYYKDIVKIISHPSINLLFMDQNKINVSRDIVGFIQKNNLVYLDTIELKKISETHHDLIDLLFKSWEDIPSIALKRCSELIFQIKKKYSPSQHSLELEYLYRFKTLFNQLEELNTNFNHLDTIKGLHHLFKELLSSETLDFKGEPLEGLQIMGMLESRVLDFETVIISAVNEGILPGGKSNNSFIPYDVKLENGLPTFKEKDAVYTYHFYRLLQRAKKVYILYNTEIDALKGGEKSRLITQLEIEGIHDIRHAIATPEVPVIKEHIERIHKTPSVMEALQKLAVKGFSPSSLTNYIRNPIAFYFEKILGIEQFEDVEENIAANTLGTVIHNTLERFYKPLENLFLTVEQLTEFKTRIDKTVAEEFTSIYKKGDFSKGKNLIIFEIAKRYISNFIDTEINSLKDGNTIKIIAIETEESTVIDIGELGCPIQLKGKVDRIDEFNGTIRVIDYKSGKVEQNKVEIVDWEDLTTDYDKYSKSFQVLCYAYMMLKKGRISLPIEAGIYSFKNLNAGLLKFGQKPSTNSRTKNQSITEDTIDAFEAELIKLILEMFDPNIDFIEKKLPNAN